MFKPLGIYIGLRYTKAKSRNHLISFISFTSMSGIALGVTALITVLSVMNGFEKELRERILGMTAHAFVTESNGTLRNWQHLQTYISNFSSVIGLAPFIEVQAMMSRGNRVRGSLIRGINPRLENQVSTIGEKIIQGQLKNLEPGKFGIILGKDLAIAMNAKIGNKITLITPHMIPTLAGRIPTLKRLDVVGIFEIGMYEYDGSLAIMNIDDASKLFRMQGKVTGIRLKLDDIYKAPHITNELSFILPNNFLAVDWTYQHSNFFQALKTEKIVMLVILLLIIAIAAFNIVTTLIIMVTDKQADISILRTVGMKPREIMAIFIVQGTLIGLFGTLLGIISGIFLAMNIKIIMTNLEKLLGYQFLPADIYYISNLPSDLHWNDVAVIGITALLLSLLSTLYPSWCAAKIKPAEALRYE